MRDPRRPLMVLGCTSSAGKSLLVTALVRWFQRRGVDVVPFKAQQHLEHSRSAEDEIAWPTTRRPRPPTSTDVPRTRCSSSRRPRTAARSVGTASPATTSRRCRGAIAPSTSGRRWPTPSTACAPSTSWSSSREPAARPRSTSPISSTTGCSTTPTPPRCSSADIDRGGAFAHLYGTWALAPPATSGRLAGFVLNKFRGDASLLEPGPSDLRRLTGMEYAGLLPMLDHELPDEEGATIRAVPDNAAPVVAVVRYPYASNLDELHLLGHVAHVRWATRQGDLSGAQLVILPGSKHVAADVAWLRRQGLDDAVRSTADRRVLDVCGGAMMLARRSTIPPASKAPPTGSACCPSRPRWWAPRSPDRSR